MISGLSKFVSMILSSLLLFSAFLMILFAFLAPVEIFHSKVAFLKITPSDQLLNPGSSTPVDGPSAFLGFLGSCTRPNNAGQTTCTSPKLSTRYDLSALPSDAPSNILLPPTSASPIVIVVALSLLVTFLITHTAISYRHHMGNGTHLTLEKPSIQRLSSWIGFLAFIVGLSTFLIQRIWFGKSVIDFNSTIQMEQGPQLVAQIGDAFLMVYIAYGFVAVPVVISLVKLNVRPPPKK